ncbi:MAG: hypothetical protein IH868_01860 [Chloroflexi bacterium]|nr:hypothetical protein [Chloroflexota bacterium]
MALALMLAVACGGSGSEAPVPTPPTTPELFVAGPTGTSQPSIETPSSVSAVDATPTIEVASPAADHTSFDIESLSIAACNTFSSDAPLPAFGTVPVPTPTPVPTPVVAPTPRSADVSRQDLSEYLPVMSLIADAISVITGETEALWARTDHLASRAEQLFIESRRVAALCNTLSLTPTPPEAKAARTLASLLLIQRREWAADVAELIRGSGQSSDPALEAARAVITANVTAFQDEIASLAADYGAVAQMPSLGLKVTSERVRVAFTAPAGWLLVRSDSRITLTAPLDLQAPGIRGLGPGREPFGTSIGVRRVRSVPGWTLADANQQIASLLGTFGAPIGAEDIEIDGNAGTLHRFIDETTDWETGFAVSVAGDYSFFIETGCPTELASECRSRLFEILESMSLDG